MGSLISKKAGVSIGELLSKVIKLTDFGIMNNIFIKLWTEFIIGITLYGFLFTLNRVNTWADKGLGFLNGMFIFGIVFYFTDMRKYNKLVNALEILKITNDEEFEKFIEENGEI